MQKYSDLSTQELLHTVIFRKHFENPKNESRMVKKTSLTVGRCYLLPLYLHGAMTSLKLNLY